MDKDRLLTKQAMDEICNESLDGDDFDRRLITQQDAKTAAIVRAEERKATLRAVGEAFEARSFVVASNMPELDGKTAVYLEQSDLTALRNGQWPAGWEGR